jgi:hypothetical protein
LNVTEEGLRLMMREKLWKRAPADADVESGKAEDAATNDQETASPHDGADADQLDEERPRPGDAGETFPIVSREPG